MQRAILAQPLGALGGLDGGLAGQVEAARLGAALEPYRMFWIEDPTPAEDQSAFRLIRQHTTTPIAVGEVFNSIWDCQQLITERLIDYIRTTVVHATPADGAELVPRLWRP
jgi:L-alanine-DL-glutamate epimerase-like enolase superfamily enzyme